MKKLALMAICATSTIFCCGFGNGDEKEGDTWETEESMKGSCGFFYSPEVSMLWANPTLSFSSKTSENLSVGFGFGAVFPFAAGAQNAVGITMEPFVATSIPNSLLQVRLGFYTIYFPQVQVFGCSFKPTIELKVTDHIGVYVGTFINADLSSMGGLPFGFRFRF